MLRDTYHKKVLALKHKALTIKEEGDLDLMIDKPGVVLDCIDFLIFALFLT